MPRNFSGDALHVAVASIYKMDYLLTWNCTHLANAQKKRHLRVINTRLRLTTRHHHPAGIIGGLK